MSKSTELYQMPKSAETESIIKSNTDMTTNSYATLSGIKGVQFGKEIFSSILKFKDLEKFLSVFSEVQRNVSKRKVTQIKTYIMSRIEDDTLMRFFSALTVTVRSNAFYDEANKQIAIEIGKSKLSLNDGQHRYYGIIETLNEYRKKRNKAKTPEDEQKYKEIIEQLEEMVVPLVIFSNMSEAEEKQLFFDLNSLAQRPSRNSNIRLSQTDILSRLARTLATENPYLKKYGVEFDKNSIHKNNPNFILLTTIYNFIKILHNTEIKYVENFITDENFDYHFERLNELFNNIFEVLPKDLNSKGKYVLEKNFAFRGMAAFLNKIEYYKLDSEGQSEAIAAIKKVKWEQDFNFWLKYGASISERGILIFPNNGEGGVNAIKKACFDKYTLKDL